MKQAELQHYRALLQAQALEQPVKRRLFGHAVVLSGVSSPAMEPTVDAAGPPVRRAGPLFGRRRAGTIDGPAEAPLLLDQPLSRSGTASAGRMRLRAPVAAAHFSETPYLAEDLTDPPPRAGVMPGVIAGWSAAKPEGAERRLLRRLAAVLQAEHHGLAARLASAEVA